MGDNADQCDLAKVIRCAEGRCEAESLDALIATCRPMIAAHVSNACGQEWDPADLEDVVQDASVRLLRAWSGFEFSSVPKFRRWLATIAQNAVVDAGRRRRSRRLRQLTTTVLGRQDDGSPTPSANAHLTEQVAVVEAAMNRLTEAHRVVIVLRDLERIPFAEVGARIGRSADAAESLYRRAIAELRRRVGS